MTMDNSDKARILKNISSDAMRVITNCLNVGGITRLPHFSDIVDTSDRNGLLYVARHVTPDMRFMTEGPEHTNTVVDSNGNKYLMPTIDGNGRIVYTDDWLRNMPDAVVRLECNNMFGIKKDSLLDKLLPFCRVFTFINAHCCPDDNEDSLMYRWATNGIDFNKDGIPQSHMYLAGIRKKTRDMTIDEQIADIARMAPSTPLYHRHHIIPIYNADIIRDMKKGD